MRGEGLLGVVCALLIAAGATSCRVEVEGAKPTRKVQDHTRAAQGRKPPLAKTPQRSDPRGSDQVGICDPASSPVMIVVVESRRQVK